IQEASVTEPTTERRPATKIESSTERRELRAERREPLTERHVDLVTAIAGKTERVRVGDGDRRRRH
ncbi:hypothetical protein U1Q18_032372, partial [Sarracenia purpurea var. burkii]